MSVWRNLNLARSTVLSCIAASSLRPRPTWVLRSRLDKQTLSINLGRYSSGSSYNVPPSSEFVARVSGISTMAKLPYQETAEGLHAAFVGVPIDTGTSYRPGARYGCSAAFYQSLQYLQSCVSF